MYDNSLPLIFMLSKTISCNTVVLCSDMSEVLREFQCKMCFKILGSRAALQRHLKEVHHKVAGGKEVWTATTDNHSLANIHAPQYLALLSCSVLNIVASLLYYSVWLLHNLFHWWNRRIFDTCCCSYMSMTAFISLWLS